MLKKSLPDVVLIGRGPLARETSRDLAGRARVVGAFTVGDEPQAPGLDVPPLGSLDRLTDFLTTNPVDEVYFATDIHSHHDRLQAAVRECEQLGIPFAVPAHTFRLGRALPVHASATEDGYLHYRLTISRPFEDGLKRAADIALSLAALVALSPLLLATAAAIKLTSPGPVFFTQIRVGLRGRHFPMFKFRSMVVDAERLLETLAARNEQTGPVFKMQHDPRVTRVGRFIRAYSIDELPQLFNILLGHMSIVGPRPPVPREVAQYKPWQRRRLSVRPGLTCLWQVQGRNAIGFDEWMMLDLQYVDQWSLGTDVSLIGKTVPVVVSGRGAS